MFTKLKLLFQAKAVADAWRQAQKEGTLKSALSVLWHTVLLSAPAIGGFAAKALSDALVTSHTPLLVAIGTILGTALPWLSQPPKVTPGQ